ncbi:hypothetical protein [Fodinicola feengrottensis]|uniref:hypothetical protein n=1 Tax=Fodinicola feengrottensis TaxID=435914 RepID=UPI002442E30F|nr:hypothetical protein [Fodinicola feengrottensis]
MVRNPHWDQSADHIRLNLPDELDFELSVEGSVITDRLVRGQGTDQQAVSFGSSAIAPEQAAQILASPALKQRTITGFLAGRRRLSLSTRRKSRTSPAGERTSMR